MKAGEATRLAGTIKVFPPAILCRHLLASECWGYYIRAIWVSPERDAHPSGGKRVLEWDTHARVGIRKPDHSCFSPNVDLEV